MGVFKINMKGSDSMNFKHILIGAVLLVFMVLTGCSYYEGEGYEHPYHHYYYDGGPYYHGYYYNHEYREHHGDYDHERHHDEDRD